MRGFDEKRLLFYSRLNYVIRKTANLFYNIKTYHIFSEKLPGKGGLYPE